MNSQPSSFRQYAGVAILFLLLASAVIGKAFLIPNCMAYDTSDDFNHTFTGLKLAKELLSNGSMPYFNFYNNFGTPLMGDALTYPFALQAIPYYLVDFSQYPVVATVNKFVMCCATLTALLVFYRTFNITVFSSAIAAICVFFNFGFFWHFAHHHYQATLLFAAAILACQRIFINSRSWYKLYFSVTLLFAWMIYSVSANLILLSFVFFVLHPAFYKKPKAFIINTLALFTGGIFGGVQVVTTVLAMMNSVRSAKSYVDVFYIHFTSSELLLRALFQDRPSGVHLGHTYLVMYFPVFILLAFIVGVYLFKKDKNKDTFAVSLGLGLLPMLLTTLMLINTGFWKATPLLKSTDITRILWIAMIFVGIGIGNFSDALKERIINRQMAWLIAVVITIAACVCTLFVVKERSPAIYLFGYWISWGLMLVYLLQDYVNERFHNSTLHVNLSRRWPPISIMLILLAVIFTYFPIVHYLGYWTNPTLCRSINYFSEIPMISPVYGMRASQLRESGRFAMNSNSIKGDDLVYEIFDRHGAGARSIAMDGKLQATLLSKGMIVTDDSLGGYHFINPWDVSISNKLGLRYFGALDGEIHDNWKIIDTWGTFTLYENEQKPSIVYLNDGNNKTIYIESFKIKGNDLIVDIPQNTLGGRLHVTITARPGFSVYVDGKKHSFATDEFGFIYADIIPGNKTMKVSYNPLDFSGVIAALRKL